MSAMVINNATPAQPAKIDKAYLVNGQPKTIIRIETYSFGWLPREAHQWLMGPASNLYYSSRMQFHKQ